MMGNVTVKQFMYKASFMLSCMNTMFDITVLWGNIYIAEWCDKEKELEKYGICSKVTEHELVDWKDERIPS